MPKVDFKRELKHLYNPSAKEVVFVDVPKMNFLMVDGAGDPNNSKEFQDATEALYSVSYSLKFSVKRSVGGVDYGVMPLEGLWWTKNMAEFDIKKKDKWQWTLMIMQPAFITMKMVESAVKEVEEKKELPALSAVRFESFEEGKAAQIMHIGPYADEAPTIEKIHKFIEESGSELIGKHHEIYLSDPRKAKPEKMKTVLRQPVTK